MKTNEYFNRLSNPFCITICLALLFLIGALDYLTGEEITFSVFYLIPVSLVSWRTNRWIGILFCFSSAIVWFYADILAGHVYSHPIIPYWNAFVRLCFFVVVSYLLTRLKASLTREKILARSDALTGLLNIRAFSELAEIEMNRSRRFKRPFTIGYIDLDNFKMVNDEWGHSVGDTLLQLVGEVIKKNTRAVNIAARLGGDEFAILLTETGIEDAKQAFSRLQEIIIEAMRGNKWGVTLSIGSVTYNNPPDRVDDMIKRADNLMYSAKSSGKNRIVYEVVD